MRTLSPLDYCTDQLKRYDYDRYLCTLFTQPALREAAIVLFAFNLEIASIEEIASEELIAHMRIAWWRDVIIKAYAGKIVKGHPVAEALGQLIQTRHFTRDYFERLLAARVWGVKADACATIQTLERYCHESSALLLLLCAEAAGIKSEIAIENVGKAWAMIGLLRARRAGGLEHFSETLAKQGEVCASEWLENAKLKGDSRAFIAFKYASEFYLKRLQKTAFLPRPLEKLRLILYLLTKK